MGLLKLFDQLKNSSLFKDSFWAVFGNGLGNVLLLVSGILIARYLGKDLYGEYGVVKTNMFYLAGFSTFGLGFTSTRFIAKYKSEAPSKISKIVTDSTKISFFFSLLIAILLVLFSRPLADFMNVPEMQGPFIYLSFIIIIRSLGTTGTGILAGLREFKAIAINSVVSGIVMLICCFPFTYYWGLNGALIALSVSQCLNTVLNYIKIHKCKKAFPIKDSKFKIKELITFSFPVAMQEISYSLCNWAGILALTKYSSIGEVGIYSATAQWNAIILFIPGLLHNVVLSHLSSIQKANEHKNKIRNLILVYLCCTLIPFIIIYLLSDFIVSFYGSQFSGMVSVLRVLTLSTIPLCCSDIFKSELLALGKPWVLFGIRCSKDVIFVVLLVILLLNMTEFGGAIIYATTNLLISALFFIALYLAYRHIYHIQLEQQK